MYRCQICNNVSKPNEPCNMITTRKYLHHHPSREKVHKKSIVIDGKKKNVYVNDPGGQGFQIIQEIRACKGCSDEFNRENKKTLSQS